jgi:hypothetical protein
MKLDKLKNTYNDYKVELSWGQLEVIAAALEADHSDPVADELYAELRWYMERVPGPGEEEEDAKNREAGGVPGAEGEDDFGVPLPPGNGAADTGAEPPGPLDDQGAPGTEGAEGAPLGEPPGEEGPPGEGGVPPPPEGEGAAKVPLTPEGEVPVGKEAFDAAKERNKGGAGVPPPPMESAPPKKSKRLIEGLESHASEVLAAAGLRPGYDFHFQHGLNVTEESAAAAVGALNNSNQFSQATYHPETGKITFGGPSKIGQPATQPAGTLPEPPLE